MNSGSFPDATDHFAFGENWASFTAGIDGEKIAEARKGLTALLQTDALTGLSFLDIGSGSGLHSLAAAQLGAAKIVALDIDPISVATTRATLHKYAPAAATYDVRHESILNPALSITEQFDIVYSWGVLHHTGQMHAAITRAAQFVRPGGAFAFALYRKTPLCGFWKVEKRLYAKAAPWMQSVVQTVYVGGFRLAFLIRKRSFKTYVAQYARYRGMDFYHDVHDWLGGWPYESAAPSEVRAWMNALRFTELHANVQRQGLGLFGSGCDEYLYRRDPVETPRVAAERAAET